VDIKSDNSFFFVREENKIIAYPESPTRDTGTPKNVEIEPFVIASQFTDALKLQMVLGLTA